MPLDAESVLNGRYRIVALLGQGGMGAVYRAFDQRLGRNVAIKENFQPSSQAVTQFEREASLLAALRHANLPVVFDNFVTDESAQYLVMEFIEGEDLQQMIDRQGPLPEEEALRWIDQVGAALDYLHRQSHPIIHRDVKPSNIKITPAGEAILVDFGIAKVYSEDLRTQTGAQAVTPGYSPPEQYGGAATDARSDVFSLAATLNALLTGAPPTNSLDRLVGKKLLLPPISVNPNVSKHVSAAIMKALELDPTERYATVAEFRNALQRQAAPATQNLAPATMLRGGSTPIMMRPEAVAQIPATSPNRRRFVWLLAGGIVIPVVILAAVGIAIAASGGTFNPAALFEQSPTAAPTVVQPPTSTSLPTFTASAQPGAPTTTSVPAVVLDTETPPPVATDTALPALPTDTMTPDVPLGPTAMGGGEGRITFWSHESGLNRIFTVNPDGTGLGEIARGIWPDWAPDGRLLAFIVSQLAPTPDESLYVRDPRKPEPDYIMRVPVEDNHLDWSPDGQYILLSNFSGGGGEARALVLLDPATKEIQVLLDDGATNLDAEFSPDGSHIVFASNKSGDFELYVMPIDGSEAPQQVTFSNGFNERNPSWSPDGQRIAFTSNDGGLDQIYAMRADGNDLVRITNTSTAERQPSWSPDGLHIAWASFRDGNLQIYLMDQDGQNPLRLTTRYSFPNQNPTWQPQVK